MADCPNYFIQPFCVNAPTSCNLLSDIYKQTKLVSTFKLKLNLKCFMQLTRNNLLSNNRRKVLMICS